MLTRLLAAAALLSTPAAACSYRDADGDLIIVLESLQFYYNTDLDGVEVEDEAPEITTVEKPNDPEWRFELAPQTLDQKRGWQ